MFVTLLSRVLCNTGWRASYLHLALHPSLELIGKLDARVIQMCICESLSLITT